MDVYEREADNAKILTRLSLYLNGRSDFVTAEMVDSLSKEYGILPDEAFRMLFAGGMDMDVVENARDGRIFREDFPRMLHALDAEEFMLDPYYRNIRIPDLRAGACELGHETLKAYEPFVCDDRRAFPDGASLPQIGYFQTDFRYPVLSENGRPWMSVTPCEVATVAPAAKKAHGNALTLGLGLGYFMYLASENPNVTTVTAVERNEDVISLFNAHILPQFAHKEKVRIVRGDAFEITPRLYESGKYDFVFADTWHDAGDGVDMYLKFKEMEKLAPNMEFSYWIEDTLKCYL